MNWETRYLPPDPMIWQGRVDIPANSCFYQIVEPINLLTEKLKHSQATTFAIIGFKCDEGAQRDLNRTGAFEGPIAIRQRLSRLPIHKTDIALFDVGNIVCTDHDLEASQAALSEIIELLIQHNICPIVLGGGHELSLGCYLGIARTVPRDQRLGIINFDSHFDLHPMHPVNRASCTTVFYQIADAHRREARHLDYNCIGIQTISNIRESFEIAERFDVKFILADDFHQGHHEKCNDFIDRITDENSKVYLSLSLDVFSPAFAPGVSTIQPLGLNPWQLIPYIRQAAASGKVTCYDIAEHVPRYDIDHRTAKLAASLIYEIIHNHQDHHQI